jgi:hypothetical protein
MQAGQVGGQGHKTSCSSQESQADADKFPSGWLSADDEGGDDEQDEGKCAEDEKHYGWYLQRLW